VSDLQQQVTIWLAKGQTGLSSLTMAHWLAFAQPYHRSSHPYDPDDLRRCLLLLDAAPLLRPELHLMAEVSTKWAALVARWDDLETLLRSELPSGRAPLTYELMQKVLYV
jgi:hypothetical protein